MRITRQRHVFLGDMRRRATEFDVRTGALKAACQRILRLAVTISIPPAAAPVVLLTLPHGLPFYVSFKFRLVTHANWMIVQSLDRSRSRALEFWIPITVCGTLCLIFPRLFAHAASSGPAHSITPVVTLETKNSLPSVSEMWRSKRQLRSLPSALFAVRLYLRRLDPKSPPTAIFPRYPGTGKTARSPLHNTQSIPLMPYYPGMPSVPIEFDGKVSDVSAPPHSGRAHQGLW